MKESKRIVVIYGAKEENWVGGEGGGIHKAVINQLHVIRACGWKPFLLTASAPCAREAQGHGYEVHHSLYWHNGLRPQLSLECLSVMRRLRRESPLAIVHHSGRTWPLGRTLLGRAPNIEVLHKEKPRPYRFFRHWMVFTEGFRDEVSRIMPDKIISVVPNAYRKRSDCRSQPSGNATLQIGYVGRTGYGKGIDILFDAMHRLQDVDFRLHMCGDPIDAEFRPAAEALESRGRLVHHGWIGRIEPFLAELDILILPSRSEAFPMTILESLAVGVPVIASRLNGPSVMIQHGINGLLFEVGDVEALAKHIRSLADPARRLPMAKAALESSRRFTPEAVAPQFAEAIEFHRRRFRETGLS
ncbi:MAG: glycosyltransferase [Gammaproteobacteria bacterium]|nr:MAG: glycosyltransferase [Gammaproteobacteria bacterium]